MLDVIPIVWNDTLMLYKSSNATRSPLLRKYLMKLTQRIGLTALPHRLPSWRYTVSFSLIQLSWDLVSMLEDALFLSICKYNYPYFVYFTLSWHIKPQELINYGYMHYPEMHVMPAKKQMLLMQLENWM